jgi:Domain of unknown function (DUF4440)
MKNTFTCLLLLLGATLVAQPTAPSLYRTIAVQDSLLFQVGFNTCDIAQFEALVSADFEFYHDQTGITDSKEDFLTSIREGLCILPYRPYRELIQGTMEVYPLFKGKRLYGAIQTGRHRFYARTEAAAPTLTSVARFTHVWVLEGDAWRLKRGLSYDHRSHEENKDGRM